jgi:type IV pilus assembly protein PilE
MHSFRLASLASHRALLLTSHLDSNQRRRSRGFTLIELMIAISIVGILTSVALPSFEGLLQRVRRTDALVSVMQVQSAQERFRSSNNSYGSLGDIGVPNVSPSKHYVLQSGANATGGYDVLAIATGTQARGAECRYMKLSTSGANPTYTSGQDESVANAAAANHACWLL